MGLNQDRVSGPWLWLVLIRDDWIFYCNPTLEKFEGGMKQARPRSPGGGGDLREGERCRG
jgi:hypothetical protein